MPDGGFIETGGARIYHEVAGRGEPLLMIHAGVADLRMWDEQVAALGDTYRIIRYDTRGYGRTETAPVAFADHDDAAAVLDHVGVASAHVVGLSRGGAIALDFALAHPQRVASLAVIAGFVDGYTSPFPTAEEVSAEWSRLAEAEDWSALADWETAYWADGPGQPHGRAAASVRARVHDWVLTNYLAEKEEGIPEGLEPAAASRLGELSVPLLVALGTLDEEEINDHCRFLAASVPGARLEVFEGCAHMVNLEQPERFNALLADFLAAV